MEHARGSFPILLSLLIFCLDAEKILTNVRQFLSYQLLIYCNFFQSHHRPREGPFELNDVFAITNAVPAIALMSYGFFHKGLVPGLCFGAVSLFLCQVLPNLKFNFTLTVSNHN